MKHTILNKYMTAAAMLALSVAGAYANTTTNYSDADIAKKLVHEIRMYPYYTIFDNISFRVNDGTVELLGEVNQPFKKDDLGRLAQHVKGVTSITNDVKVLSLSNFDDRLRVQVARAIYRDPVLSRYSLQVVPPIHIIVDQGHVTLEGVVATEMERNEAGIRANGAGLSFGVVTNNLQVEQPNKSKS